MYSRRSRVLYPKIQSVTLNQYTKRQNSAIRRNQCTALQIYNHLYPRNSPAFISSKSPLKAMESSKKLGKSFFDSISSLPDELLCQILSGLPTKCAVSTSILSKRWRYLFTLTDCLSFDDAPYFGDSRGRNKIETGQQRRFRKFVYKVLELHQIAHIKKFKLFCGGAYGKSDLNAWVSNAVQKGVQELHYQVADGGLPDGLVMCETVLKLSVIGYEYYVIEIPLSTWLPSLRILYLDFVGFVDYDSMQRLFSSCELLEELTLESCESYASGHVSICTGLLKVLTLKYCSFHDGLFEIDAPNLAYLTYNCNDGVKIVSSWKYSCSLVEVELHFNCHAEDHSLENDSDIFRAAAYKTTELHLLSDSVELLLRLAYHEQMPDFHSLSRLHLCYIPYDSWKYVTSLLDKSPQLTTVIFEQGLHCCSYDPVSPPSDSLIGFSCHAQVIEVHEFCGHEGSLLLLGHLLRNAKVLKKLIVRECFHSDVMGEELQLRKNLLKLPRASSDCRIEIK
ncbi:F-box/LRR-repeat protein At4g14103-like [Silene latifolia]|uniref:F-box/LRR-repeat protein At4g14103-like n=1 Tax=Silene latifolia TaxID=37657 RepID=UPI003D778CD2